MALHSATLFREEDTVRRLLFKGIRFHVRNENGGTAIYGAASNGNEQIVRLLLDKGAKADAKTYKERLQRFVQESSRISGWHKYCGTKRSDVE